MEKIVSLRRMSRETLSALLLSARASQVAVIDVRGADHVGGHIRNSQHVPSTSLDHRIPELVRTLANKDIVVFHCALSQERGPRAARWYMREREKKMTEQEVSGLPTEKRKETVEAEDSTVPSLEPKSDIASNTETHVTDVFATQLDPQEESQLDAQEVYVLDGGFVKWQEK